jgi:hypothetical protein
VDVKVMKKCDYCGKKIGFFSVMYTWLDKEKDLVIHDKCLKEWEKKNPDKIKEIEKIFQIDKKILVDKGEYLASYKWNLKRWEKRIFEKEIPDKIKEDFIKHKEDMIIRLEKDVEKNVNQDGKVEIPFSIDDLRIISDNISKGVRYLCYTHPTTKEERIKQYEDEIEELKKEEDFPYKENILKEKNDMLNYLKQTKT